MNEKNIKVKPRKPSGFLELLPNDQIAFNRLVEIIRETYESFGFTPIETPAMELTEVLLAKGGGEIDKQIYSFSKGDTNLSLHFDLTVPLARYVAENYSNLSFPFRRYQMQKVWRAERAQRGRYREFLQCDIDIIGSNSLLADAEMVSVISSVFEKMKIGDFTVRISNRKILAGFLESIGLGEETGTVLRIVDKLEKRGTDIVVRELQKMEISDDKIKKLLDFIGIRGDSAGIFERLDSLGIRNSLFAKGVDELRTTMNLTNLLGVPSKRKQIDLAIARGLDYYTGVVYETFLDGFHELGSIASGGRYDNLAGYYIDKSLPGVGISIGLTRLFSKLKQLELVNSEKSTPSKILIVQMDEKFLESCLSIARSFRENGVPTEVYPKLEKLKKQLDYANKIGIDFVGIIGESEYYQKKISVKRMASGEQLLLDIGDAIKLVKETNSGIGR